MLSQDPLTIALKKFPAIYWDLKMPLLKEGPWKFMNVMWVANQNENLFSRACSCYSQ